MEKENKQTTMSELEKIREILLGSNIDEVKRLINDLYLKIDENSKLSEEKDIELQGQINALGNELKSLDENNKNNFADIRSESRNILAKVETLDQEMKNFMAESANNLNQLREELIHRMNEYQEKNTTFIKQELDALKQQKIEKNDLAKLFSEVAEKIQNQ